MGFVALVYGLVAYTVFLLSLLYAVGFIGDYGVPKTIDSLATSDVSVAVVVDLVLLGLFAVQHSVMARPWFKAAWTRVLPKALERSTYVLLSSLLLALILWKWQPIPGDVWNLSGTAVGMVIGTLYALGWMVLLLSTFMINHFELFGLRQVYFRWRNTQEPPLNFTQRAFYRFVRHPLMLGFVIAFWATPHMSLGHLLFAVATTGYILIGIMLEERDLMRAHKAEYGEYRSRVPMLFPWPR